jgi:hypothetical protein
VKLDLDAIEARRADCQTYNFGLRNADKLAHEDVPALLALVREQQATILAQAEELELAAREYDDWYLRDAATRAAVALQEVLK